MSATEIQIDPEAGHQDPAVATTSNTQSDQANPPATVDESKISCIYFGYGSNLSPVTMKQRCPDSLFVGLARLSGWRWMINETGYANIVPGSADHEVYGSLCFLSGRDEAALDESEGVPWLYEKKMLTVQRLVPGSEIQEVEALAYVDVQRVEEGRIEKEYVVWVRKAIEDAAVCGLPMAYAEKYLVKYLPEKMEPLRETMMVRTMQFRDKDTGMIPRGFASWSRG